MAQVLMIRSHYPDTRLEKEADALRKSGHSVCFLVWDRGRISQSRSMNTSEVLQFRAKVHPDDLRVILYLPLWWLFIIHALTYRDFDVVHAADLDTYVPALLVAKLKRKKIVYDIYDFYAEMIQFPLLADLSKRCISVIDRCLMEYADIVILPDPARIKQVGIRDTRKIVIIANSPKESTIDGIPSRPSDNRFRIFYGGNIQEDRYLDEVCRIVRNLPGVYLSIHGPCSEQYSEKLQEISRGSENIQLSFGWVAHKEILAKTMEADLLFALYNPRIPNNCYASPNKLFEAMLCGKPIIVNSGSTMTSIVRDTECGLIVPFGDPDAFREAVQQLREDPSLRDRLGTNARAAYENLFRWEIMEERLSSTYGDLTYSAGPYRGGDSDNTGRD
ncbi:glycosyltransferase family 4 protein [Methanoculleus sp. UBA303]|uniref:glycosyltransferase family 4 protein n=1 Tax=Methanoculleus sp. UBA303 TaxID=1915497 RepID=UPI0025FE38DE|nr:glycosyltransferase family 4 protein [Methanoculleus sp. UBA303]